MKLRLKPGNNRYLGNVIARGNLTLDMRCWIHFKKFFIQNYFTYFFIFLIMMPILYNFPVNAEIIRRCERDSGIGFLERDNNGNLILYLEGTYYDMGYQHGILTRDLAQITLRSIKETLKRELKIVPLFIIKWYLYNFIYRNQKKYIPQEYKDEMKGLSDATGVPLKEIQTMHALIFLTSCTSAALWGEATFDGRLIFSRSNDAFFSVDPVSKESAQSNGMIVIYKPVNQIPFMMISWPGYIGAGDGMNAKGIVLANNFCPSRYESPKGMPMIFRIKYTLAHAENLKEAISHITRTPYEGGYMFIVGDAKIPDAAVIEMNSRKAYIGSWDGEAESNTYIYKQKKYSYQNKPGFLFRTNHPLSDIILKDYKGTIYKNEDYRCYTGPRFQEIQSALFKKYSQLDIPLTHKIIRGYYRDLIHNNVQTCMPSSTHQFTIMPATGDFIISFANGNPDDNSIYDVSAYNKPFYEYNFFKLLNKQFKEAR